MAGRPEYDERVVASSIGLYGDLAPIARDRSAEEDQRILNIAAMGALFLNKQSIDRGGIEAVSGMTQKLADDIQRVDGIDSDS